MPISIETVTESDQPSQNQPSQNSAVSVENRNESATNIATSQGMVGSNRDDKIQTKTAKSKKRNAKSVDIGQNALQPEPASRTVNKRKSKPTKKNVESVEAVVFEAKGRRDVKKAVTSEEPVEKEKSAKCKANKTRTAKIDAKPSNLKQIAEESTDQTDGIKQKVVPAAKGRKREASAISTPTDESPAKKDKKDITATANGTHNEKCKR